MIALGRSVASASRRASGAIAVGVLALLGAGCAGHGVYTSASYRGSVVDAETKQPLVRAVVLAVWYREVPVAPHGPAKDYHDALELLTDANGTFVLPAKTHFTPIGKILEPEFIVYYPGYASFPGLGARPANAEEVDPAYAKREFNFELTKLKTREERLRGNYPLGALGVPDEKMPNLIRLVNEEGRALGLEPIRRLGR